LSTISRYCEEYNVMYVGNVDKDTVI